MAAEAAAPVFVFLGPSLPLVEARRHLDATFLPPVAMGDVHRLIERRPAAIAIIDGLFEQTPAVWHKEILFALARGIRVFGASSMGALRAAELHRFGMEGVGAVFEAFRDGRLEDDDEVAVVHAPAADGFRPLSDAMVSIRFGLARARDEGLISGGVHDALVAHAKRLFYAERSWAALVAAAPGLGLAAAEVQALAEFLRRERPDAKRADAVRLLQHLAAEGERGWRPHQPNFGFEPTYWWEQMALQEGVLHEAAEAGGAALRRHVRLGGARGDEVLRTALLLALLHDQAQRQGLAPVDDLDRVAPDAAALPAGDRARLAHSEAAHRHLARLMGDGINRWLPAALARLGGLRPALAAVERKQRLLRARGIILPTLADAGVDRATLLAWYHARHPPGAPPPDPDTDATALGFTSSEEFWGEIVAEYLAATAPDEQ